jgi:phage-related protein (TIGR01555 family)
MLNVATKKKDGWENVITGLGTARDKRVGSRLIRPPNNVSYQQNEDLFFSSDLARTAAELHAQEMVREWISVTANDPSILDTDTRTEVEADATTEEKISLGNRVLNKLQDLGAQTAIFQSKTWAAVFGGGLIFLGVNDGGGNDPNSLEKPLDENGIRSFDFLEVYDRFDMEIDTYYADPSKPNFGKPEIYRLTNAGGSMVRIHESRLIRFDGTLTNRRRMQENGGWADPIFTRTRNLIRDYDVAWGSISHILQDFAQAIFKMKGLKDAILSDKDDLILRRMAQIDLCRGTSRAVPLDADGEDFDRKQTPIGGIPEVMDRFAYRMAAAFRTPSTLLFGQSPSGMQATGAADIRFFYDQIKAQQESDLRPKLERMIRLIFLDKSGPTKGAEPNEWSFIFNPLYRLTELEEAQLRNTQANTDKIYVETGIVSEDEVGYSRFGGDRYSPETVLDLDERNKERELNTLEAPPDPMLDPADTDPDNGETSE